MPSKLYTTATRDTTDDTQKFTTSDSDSDGKTDLADRRAGGKSSSSNRSEFLGSGHSDPFQRKLYLGLHVFSLSTALIGLILLCVWIFKYKTGVSFTDTKRMGNLHALFMYTFMVGLNAYGRSMHSMYPDAVIFLSPYLPVHHINIHITNSTYIYLCPYVCHVPI